MKAKELMIGDWVISNKRRKNEIVQVVSIDGGTNCCWLDADCYSGVVSYKDIKPIPLTAEIWGANGFNVGDYTVWKYNCGCYLLVVNPEIGKTCIYETHGHFTSGFETKSLQTDSFRYVHEFQHALRLLGLVELADDFNPPHP